jgi:hypothetical protein
MDAAEKLMIVQPEGGASAARLSLKLKWIALLFLGKKVST